MARTQRKALIEEIEKKRKSKVFCLLTSDRPNLNVQMMKDILPIFVQQLRPQKNYDRIDLFLFTLGGDTLSAFGLSRLLREYAPWIGTLIPEKCQSAGTLFALGSNEILMTRGATLSPIDPSIIRPLNPAVQTAPGQPPQLVPLSVESVAGFKALVSEDWHLGGEASLVTAFKVLAEKVHPLALGDVFRVRQQIEHLATQLLKQHRSDGDKIKEIVDTLTKRLGSHDYLIFRSEAEKILGTQIAKNDSVEDLIWELYLDFAKEMFLGIPFDLNLTLQSLAPTKLTLPSPPVPGFLLRQATETLKLVVIESKDRGDAAQHVLDISEELVGMNGTAPQTRIAHSIQSAGWVQYS